MIMLNKSVSLPLSLSYTIFSVVKLDLYIRALLLDHILAWKKISVHLVIIIMLTNKIQLMSLNISDYYKSYRFVLTV